MSLEAATYLSELVASNPVAGDDVSQGDDHIRLLKAVLLATFPNGARPFRFYDTKAVTAGDLTVSSTDDLHKLLPINATAAQRTVTLPSLAIDGWWAIIQKTDSSSNAVVIDPAGSDTINGASTVSLTVQYESMLCWWDEQANVWVGFRFFPSKPYYSGGQDIPFSDIAPSANAKRILAATTATDFSEHTMAAILEFLSASFARGDLLARGASFFDRLAIGGSSTNPAFLTGDGTDPTWTRPSGMAVGRAYTDTTATTILTALTPCDDTIPQVGEGTEIMSFSYTAKNANNRLRIEVDVFASLENGNAMSCVHLHKDGGANAVAAAFQIYTRSGAVDGNDKLFCTKLVYEVAAGSTSSATWSVRAGASADDFQLNQGADWSSSTLVNFGGGVMRSTMRLTEFAE